MNGTLEKVFSALLSSAGSTGAAIWTPKSRKDLGSEIRIGSYSKPSWITTAKRNGQPSSRISKEELKTL